MIEKEVSEHRCLYRQPLTYNQSLSSHLKFPWTYLVLTTQIQSSDSCALSYVIVFWAPGNQAIFTADGNVLKS